MKKYFLVSALSIAVLLVLPQTTRAQWTDPYTTYRTNGLIINSPKKKAVPKKVVKKKTVRRKSKTAVRKPSAVTRGSTFDSDRPKAILVG